MNSPSPVLWLEEIGVEDRPIVGGKAAALAALLRQGLPVPPGFCLPAVSLPAVEDTIWEALWAAYLRLAPQCGPVAVRSSGLQEDSETASYAGQFDTLLDVQGEAALKAAIRRVQESLHSTRAASYRETRGEVGNGRAAGMAVLVQRQVPAVISGVMFTRDPVTGDGSQVLIEATLGLGDSLLAGRDRGEQARVGAGGSVYQPDENRLLSDGECQALARLARQVEQVLGPAQDIEWAIGPGATGEREIYLLQARPVTAAAVAPPLRSVWTRANIGEVLPDPVTPLTWSVFQSTLLGSSAQEAGLPGEPALRRHLGRAYLRLDALFDSFCYLPGVTAGRLYEVLGVKVPAGGLEYSPPRGLKVRLAQMVFWLDALAGGPRLGWLSRRLARPEQQDLEGMLAWTAACFRLHLKATASAIAAYSALKDLSSRLPAEEQEQVSRLMRGSDDMQTAAQGRELWRLAEQAAGIPGLRALFFEAPDWEALKGKALALPGGAGFVAEMEAFLEANGARAAGEFELAAPRWREQPGELLQVLRLHILTQQPGEAQAAPAAASEQGNALIIARLSPARRWLFRRMLRAYLRYAALRENLKFRLIEGYAGLRRYFLDLGGRLHTAGLLPAVEDIFYLDMEEIRSLQAGELPAAQASRLAQQRREERTRWAGIPVPDLLAGDGGFGQSAGSGAEAAVLVGIGCCPGTVAGRARVLRSIQESASLQPGEILVAPHTDPGWTPLFLSCRALVTETGGFLSHGATVAREYGIPCVASVPAATRRIRTGDWIQVDGTNGRVEILPGAHGGMN